MAFSPASSLEKQVREGGEESIAYIALALAKVASRLKDTHFAPRQTVALAVLSVSSSRNTGMYCDSDGSGKGCRHVIASPDFQHAVGPLGLTR